MLTPSVVIGVAWNFAEQLLRKGVAAAVTLILSYFLGPQDFGLISMMAIFLALASSLMDAGLKDGLLKRKRLGRRLINTALWASLGMGLLAYGLLFLAAPVVAVLYEKPLLLDLIRVAGLVVVLNALQCVPSARLAVALDFKSLLKANFPAALVSGAVALGSAYLGLGVWALIFQMISFAALSTALLWLAAGWRPRLEMNFRLLTVLYVFGYRLFLSSLISIAVKNVVPAVIGRYLGAAAAGYYFFVDKIMEVVMGQLVYSIQNVTYPALAKIANAPHRLTAAYRKVFAVSMFVTSPLLLIGAGIADPLFALMLPANWAGAGRYFQVLCLVYVLYPLHALNLNILKVRSRSDLYLGLEILKAGIAVGMLFLTVPYGLMAVLYGQVLTSLLCYAPNALYAKKLIDYSLREQIVDVLPYVVIAALAGLLANVVVMATDGCGLWCSCLVSGLVAGAFYLLLCRALRLQGLQLAVSLLKPESR